jgi:HSP20 family protein
MNKMSKKGAVVFGVVLAMALALVTWGFAVLKNSLAQENPFVLEKPEDFGGLGIEITMQDGFVTVVGTLDSTPANKIGVKPGDRIVKINDDPVGDDPALKDIVSKLRGEPGSEVTITVQRGDETKTFTITRQKIKVPVPKVRVIERKVPRIYRVVPGQKECPDCGWRGGGDANFCASCGKKLEKVEKKPPQDLRPFDRDWLWRRWKSTDELEQYRDALRRLEDARRDLWRSLPQPDFPDWGLLWRRDFPGGRLFDLYRPPSPSKVDEFRMDMDVEETEDTITVKCDIPGMKKEDIDITLKGNVLTIEGKREVEEETKDEEGRTVRRERRSGSFSRSFTLPGKVNADEVKTSYEEGVLTITIPKDKAEPEEEKEIKLKIGTI